MGGGVRVFRGGATGAEVPGDGGRGGGGGGVFTLVVDELTGEGGRFGMGGGVFALVGAALTGEGGRFGMGGGVFLLVGLDAFALLGGGGGGVASSLFGAARSTRFLRAGCTPNRGWGSFAGEGPSRFFEKMWKKFN